VEPEATAADAARTMWTRKITGVVVMHGDEAIGIVSQKDILVRVLSMQKNATRTPVTDIMSTPVLPIPPDYSVFMASRLMHRMRVHRLVVQDGRLITGIVSQTDILRAVERRLGEEETHRLFLVSSDIPIFMLDPRAVVTYVNAAVLRLFDFDGQAAIVGHALADARFWQSPADQQRLDAVLRREEPAILGLALRTSAGQTRRVVLLLIVSRDACDEVQSWQGVLWHASDSRKLPVGRWPLPDMRAGSTR
jgi:PAS domain-containing protein